MDTPENYHERVVCLFLYRSCPPWKIPMLLAIVFSGLADILSVGRSGSLQPDEIARMNTGKKLKTVGS
jgi:hypothetical protein